MGNNNENEKNEREFGIIKLLFVSIIYSLGLLSHTYFFVWSKYTQGVLKGTYFLNVLSIL